MALYAGGDYMVDGGSAEAEGLLVVRGNATFAKKSGGVFNVGRVGAGSGILPESGSVMLAVGCPVDRQGHDGGRGPRPDGCTGRPHPYDAFGDSIRGESRSLAALAPTGTAVRSGGTVTFKGGGHGAGPQVFEISAKDMDGASSFVFTSIPDKDAVVVNVTGGQAVGISPMSVGFNGDRVDVYDSAHFGEAASRILHNLEDSTSISLGGGGNFMGSIVAPKAGADLTASTNGRVYAGGDIRTHGTGNESHNYPWTGSSTFACKPEPTAPEVPNGTPSQPTPTPSRPGTESTPPVRPGTSTPTPDASTPTPGTSEPTPSQSTSATPPPGGGKDDGSLATTGGQIAPYLITAAALGAAGGATLLATRRRRVQR
ncbi:choice-of-anchor A family protein [Streptomyces sp. NPDC014870]|uniref:choice-of-anchor A family protein n=1 Tax=Streptomyces sp. NPDC014870 TaxID=3364925 RepID=UPI0036F8C6FC